MVAPRRPEHVRVVQVWALIDPDGIEVVTSTELLRGEVADFLTWLREGFAGFDVDPEELLA
jgi:hypothetical protein